jgi:hypothetical protein
MPTPYAEHLDGKDPVDVLRSNIAEYHELTSHLTKERWARSYAPGKWTAHQLLVHLAQWEMIFGVRARCGVAVPGYVVQPMEQDPFMAVEAPSVDGPTAWAAFKQMRRMNIAFAGGLSGAQRATKVQHPERGQIDVNDLLVTMAGHGVHHFKQLQMIAKS